VFEVIAFKVMKCGVTAILSQCVKAQKHLTLMRMD